MYISVTQLAEKLKVSTSRVRFILGEGRIVGAFKVGNVWIIPVNNNGKIQVISGKRGPKLSWCKSRLKAQAKIHVNGQKIKQNRETGNNTPVITVKRGKTNEYCHQVDIKGPCKLIYKPSNPLKSGAQVWIETNSEIELICVGVKNSS
ncbi:MAG: helix-turn-helix domain-containing protein [Methylacidiphilales bacterium]|nr:helix-turn-helix domain-containing protein [Candidatus Methylacidiphilales bacterium]NJR14698.1 helix-turn-helix domain-containing protein [Calothrix sp. CSU_2_0]